MKGIFASIFILLSLGASAQMGTISGELKDSESASMPFANVALYQAADSTLLKVEVSQENGKFTLVDIAAGNYFVVASFMGMEDVRKDGINLTAGADLDLGTLRLGLSAVALDAATVSVKRPLVEVKPDRTVFNVEGTVNNTGDDAFNLMRKAPGVTVDNNENINVLGRAGVMVYVDGKRLPLSGQDLASYLKNLPSDQIDRIDIITNPGAKYDAEGNAGIIDIRLKKDKSQGANGTIRVTGTQGRKQRGNANLTGNYRGKKVNVFGTLGAAKGEGFNDIRFQNWQNDLYLEETNLIGNTWENMNYRLGSDFYIGKNHIIGFLASGMTSTGQNTVENRISISPAATQLIDSILVANSVADIDRNNQAYNLNYRYDDRDNSRSLNIDLDYGSYDMKSFRTLPNQYFDAGEENVLTEVNNWFDTPSDIDIYTGKLDFENKLFGGKIGTGLKYSQVISDNTFIVYDQVEGTQTQNDTLSNKFKYDEKVYAAYTEYSRNFGKKIGIQAGVRAELTDAVGDLQAFLPSLAEPPVELNYLEWFPTVGLTYSINPMNVIALNFGRRINRPDYNVLNPFNVQLSQISYEKGNARLQPEIVNNAELGYTLAYRFNFKLAYSRTDDQITRLIGPDDTDPRASFISWDNLATQTIWSFNASLPFQLNEKWSAYVNLSGSHLDNQADYGDNGSVDIQAWTYNLYAQSTIDLPAGFKGEVSGWFSGPGVWGGVFLYEESWSLNAGVSKTFFDDRLSTKLTVNDIFYESGWSGVSEFNGLRGEGQGAWDSRFVSLSVGYNFGNQNVKSRKRETGLEKEAGRVGG
ncbi:MAG: iron complex outermembrane receptor protein [Litorivivens sp.]|jgi:iron complex outermembrane receptor protein